MQLLSIKNLSFKYPNAHKPLFENISFEFETGWNALVGANGSGKQPY